MSQGGVLPALECKLMNPLNAESATLDRAPVLARRHPSDLFEDYRELT
jgi:hypothetical protein